MNLFFVAHLLGMGVGGQPTAVATLTAAPATLSASAQHTARTYDGDATLTVAAATLSAVAAFEVREYAAVATLTVAAAVLSATGDVTDPDVPVVFPGQRTFAPSSRRYRGLSNSSSRYRTLR